MAKKARRTTHRSSTGTKLYAVRDARGRFKDIQTYKRAHTGRTSSGRAGASRSSWSVTSSPDSQTAQINTPCYRIDLDRDTFA